MKAAYYSSIQELSHNQILAGLRQIHLGSLMKKKESLELSLKIDSLIFAHQRSQMPSLHLQEVEQDHYQTQQALIKIKKRLQFALQFPVTEVILS